MPPPASPHQLKAEQVASLRQWIEHGAKWEGHWAFIPPVKGELPRVNSGGWGRNPIDAFILARLEQEGLSPGPEADRERLLRRVTFDLTGLPPTLEEIDAFVADTSENAYEKVVDRLLSSEHFGERMALAWMDAARYGDTSVFHADGPRDMWPWRDWVIRAFNRNQPFDQFTVEQLAGDLLPEATLQQKIATGFLRNNATTDEGGAIDEEFRVEYAVDRVKTTSVVWLGLTMECGQCHNHKYDPIMQQDYYRFFAYFNQSSDPGLQTRGGNQAPLVNVVDEQATKQAEALKAALPALTAKLSERARGADGDFLAWAKDAAIKAKDQPLLPGNVLVHLPLDEQSGDLASAIVAGEDRKAKLNGNATWVEGKHGRAFRCDGSNYIDAADVAGFERTDAFSYGAWVKPQGAADGAILARMDDASNYRGYDLIAGAGGKISVHIINTWPGNAIKVTTNNSLKPDQWQHVFITYDGSSKAAGITIYFDGQKQDWGIEQDRLSDTIRTPKPLHIGRRNPGAPLKGDIDEVRIYARQLSATEVAALAGSDPIGPLLAKDPAAWTADERQSLLTHYLNNHDAAYHQISKEIAQLNSQIAAAEKPASTVMVMQDVGSPRMTYVLNRGNYAAPNKDQPVEPGVPSALPPLAADAPANRLGLARWLVQPHHPLTARVAVNRYWQMLFGTGLVKTTEDFGAQGEPPSHADLLDWLAVDFVEHGWDVKRAIKQLVMSSTYRQSSRVTRELYERDPENRLLARGPRFRLQGEFIRDNALAASGLLVKKIGGPGVRPYHPSGLWEEASESGAVFVQDHGENLYRRSMYTYWKRSVPPPNMLIFDTPTRESCSVRRSRTNTPLQALVLLNDPQFVEAARALAQRAIKQGGSLDEQIATAYRLATGLSPSPLVLSTLKASYQQELTVFQADAERAKKLLAVGEAKRDEAIDAAAHAAMAAVCSIILNLDVALTRS
jgi:hypothetical protein